jgi:hypothetical protein
MANVLFPQHVIARKRDGAELERGEIEAFVRGATDGSWADYQLSALLMAIYLKGMTPGETAALTDAMLRSGILSPTCRRSRRPRPTSTRRAAWATRCRCTSRPWSRPAASSCR